MPLLELDPVAVLVPALPVAVLPLPTLTLPVAALATAKVVTADDVPVDYPAAVGLPLADCSGLLRASGRIMQ